MARLTLTLHSTASRSSFSDVCRVGSFTPRNSAIQHHVCDKLPTPDHAQSQHLSQHPSGLQFFRYISHLLHLRGPTPKMSVLLETSAGDIVIDLLVDYVPKMCEKYGIRLAPPPFLPLSSPSPANLSPQLPQALQSQILQLLPHPLDPKILLLPNRRPPRPHGPQFRRRHLYLGSPLRRSLRKDLSRPLPPKTQTP